MHCLCYFVLATSQFFFIFFFLNDTAPTEIYTLSLHDALPISPWPSPCSPRAEASRRAGSIVTTIALRSRARSEEHTSELQSLRHLVCRLLLEKKKKQEHNLKVGGR